MTTPGALFDQLTRLDAIEARARKGTLHTLLPELDSAVAALGADPRAAALVALRRALRVDLAFLVEHPEATFSCLYNRCFWHDNPHADAYYALPGERRPSRAPASPLQALMRRWRTTKAAEGALWPRSLRPPEVSLDGALVEEYRGEAPEAIRRLLLTRKGTRIELLHRAGDGEARGRSVPKTWRRLAWDRATGRRVDCDAVEMMDESTSPDGELRFRNDSWGAGALVRGDSGAEIGPLPLTDYRCPSPVAFTPDNRFVALGGWDEDGFGFIVVYDVKTRTPVLDVNVTPAILEIAISPRGDRVAASGSSETSVWEVATGRRIHALGLSNAVPAFTSDGHHLLTAELGVVRVWDLDFEPAILRGCRGGITSAEFSPDGQRLLTGTLLADARTGAVITHLDFERANYLVGGPPERASLVGDTRIVCLLRGLDVWDTRTGARLAKDIDRQYSLRHVIAVSHDGKCYAMTRVLGEDDAAYLTLDIIDADTGATLTEITTSKVTCMAWSPDDRTLATGSIDGRARLWDRERGALLLTVPGHDGAVTDLAFVRRGGCLATAAEDDELRVWRLDTGTLMASRPLGAGDPTLTRRYGGELRVITTWKASLGALAALGLWLDGPLDPLLWTIEERAGSLVIVDQVMEAPVGFLPANEALCQHPSEAVWAGGRIHVRLEGLPSSRGGHLMRPPTS